MVQGMAYLELYQNKACTRAIPKDSNGIYQLPINALSSNAYNPFTTTFYVKNIGSHSAYDCNITTISKSDNNMSIDTTVMNNLTMLSGDVRRCMVLVPITKGQVITKTILLKVQYDSV